MSTSEKKPLPNSVTKTQLFQMYGDQFSEKRIRSFINEILKESNYSKNIKIIPANEFKEFVETYGVPKGYYFEQDNRNQLH